MQPQPTAVQLPNHMSFAADLSDEEEEEEQTAFDARDVNNRLSVLSDPSSSLFAVEAAAMALADACDQVSVTL